MKKILFLTLLSVFTLILAITSCSNNDYEESINAKMSKNRMTRAASSSITMEEVQERLRLIGEKYGVCIMIDENEDISLIDDNYFYSIEEMAKQGVVTSNEANTSELRLINDENINEIAVASTYSTIETNVRYSGTFVEPSVNGCLINWGISINPLTYFVSAEPIIRDGSSRAVIDNFSNFTGELNNPVFHYTGCYFESYNGPYDSNNDGLLDCKYCFRFHVADQLDYKEFIGIKTTQTQPY